MLRRCLGQQGEVRLSLYLGLKELVETTPSLNPIIFEILQAHVSLRRIHELKCTVSLLLLLTPIAFYSLFISMIKQEPD
jgi:hypothetical protein